MAMKLRQGMVVQKGLGAILLKWKKAFLGDGFIVLAIIPFRGEFVTWWMSKIGETCHGHYTLELEDALDDFGKRS